MVIDRRGRDAKSSLHHHWILCSRICFTLQILQFQFYNVENVTVRQIRNVMYYVLHDFFSKQVLNYFVDLLKTATQIDPKIFSCNLKWFYLSCMMSAVI